MKSENVWTGMPSRSSVGLSRASWKEGKRAESVGMLMRATGLSGSVAMSVESGEDRVSTVLAVRLDARCLSLLLLRPLGRNLRYGPRRLPCGFRRHLRNGAARFFRGHFRNRPPLFFRRDLRLA